MFNAMCITAVTRLGGLTVETMCSSLQSVGPIYFHPRMTM